jgi:hypothetical protein
MKIGLSLGVTLLVIVPALRTTAYADTIDFEAQGANSPSDFSAGTLADSPLTIGIATFTGGKLLNHEDGAVADQTAVYATSSSGEPLLTNPLNIAFSVPISGLSIFVEDGLGGGIYTVADNLGGSESVLLPVGFGAIFSVPDSGITSVSITGPLTPNFPNSPRWDFAVDDVIFTPMMVPEPSSFVLLATGLLTFAALIGSWPHSPWQRAGDAKLLV